MRIAPIIKFHSIPTFKGETTIGPDYHYDKKPFSQYDPLDEDEFLLTEPSEDDDDYDYIPPRYDTKGSITNGIEC